MAGKPQHPFKIHVRVCELYLDGYGMSDVARLTGVSPSYVKCHLVQEGIKIRPRGLYSPRSKPRGGANHPRWLGDQVGYAGAHVRVRKARGAPQECSRCGISGPGRQYDWANLTGNYLDVNDFARMCQTCHKRYDLARRAEQ